MLSYPYNKDTNEYVYNENTIGTDVLTDFQNAYVYNFKLASEEKIDDNYVITYYGLFAFQNEIGPTSATNLTNISSHSFRKLFGVTVYNKTNGYIELLKELFNHSNISTTQRYIKVSQKQIDEISSSIDFTAAWNI